LSGRISSSLLPGSDGSAAAGAGGVGSGGRGVAAG